jgi:hypothetical protein
MSESDPADMKHDIHPPTCTVMDDMFDDSLYGRLQNEVQSVCSNMNLCDDIRWATPPRVRPRRCCVMCWKPTANQCGRCRAVRYCSKRCQREAWPLHKPDCNQMKCHVRVLVPEEVVD